MLTWFSIVYQRCTWGELTVYFTGGVHYLIIEGNHIPNFSDSDIERWHKPQQFKVCLMWLHRCTSQARRHREIEKQSLKTLGVPVLFWEMQYERLPRSPWWQGWWTSKTTNKKTKLQFIWSHISPIIPYWGHTLHSHSHFTRLDWLNKCSTKLILRVAFSISEQKEIYWSLFTF